MKSIRVMWLVKTDIGNILKFKYDSGLSAEH